MMNSIVYLRLFQEKHQFLDVSLITCSQLDCKLKLDRVRISDRRTRPPESARILLQYNVIRTSSFLTHIERLDDSVFVLAKESTRVL